VILVPVWFLLSLAPPKTAEGIMARVAVNQDRAQEMRTAYVYHQSAMIRLQRSNGKLAREEYSEFTVTPTPKGIKKERTLFRGKYVAHNKEIAFDQPGFEYKSVDIDADLGRSLLDDFTDEKDARDGIAHDLFPLTSAEQSKYDFRLDGTEDYRGTAVYRITFAPRKQRPGAVVGGEGEEQGSWQGEVLVDQKEYQPVLVISSLAEKIPAWVKVVLGTNVEHLGFKVSYQKFDDRLWFPVTYGGEFKIKALFLYSRRIGISLQNSGFQRAMVNTTVTYGGFPWLLMSFVR